ncbi:MAG TPA: TIGR03435 family protein [Vicinamibacterales bacterium]
MRGAILLLAAVPFVAQTGPAPQPSFEVASITPTAPDDRSGRFATMQGAHQFVARSYTLKYMVAAAYNVPPHVITGGPAWADSDRYDIRASTPGDARPTTDQQMAMLRTLLTDRFKLAFHREQRELPIYELTVVKRGATLEASAAPNEQPVLVNRVSPGRGVLLPARNATMTEFAAILQRSVLDRHVVDKTGLTGRYDFDLEWTYDETQFGGQLPPVTGTPEKPFLFAALQEQLGLRLQAARGNVETIVIDRVERPS